MAFLLRFLKRCCVALVALAFFLVGGSAAAQSGQGDVPVGDARPATLGDLNDVRQEIRENRHEIRDLRQEIREGNSNLRQEMRERNSNLRQEMREENNLLRQEMREEMRELRETMNAMWATMVLGFAAIFAAVIQSGRQTRVKNNPHSVSRPVNKLQVPVAAVLIAVVIAAAIPVIISAVGNQQPSVVAAEKIG